MTYIICATQLVTVLCGLIAVRWCIAYAETRDKLDLTWSEKDREEWVRMKQESDQALMALISTFGVDMQRLRMDHAKERELLIERIQHPTITQGQAAGIGGETSVSYDDEEAQAKRDFPDSEVNPAVQPIQPVAPIGGNDNGSEK